MPSIFASVRHRVGRKAALDNKPVGFNEVKYGVFRSIKDETTGVMADGAVHKYLATSL
jgi:hypothetical protein